MSTAAPRPKPAVRWSERRHVGRPIADVHGRRGDVVLASPIPALQRLVDSLTPAVYLDLGRPCNSACLYCAVPPHEDAQGFLPLTEVAGIALAGRQVGCDRAILIGGEPTIYPQLGEALGALQEAGLRGPHIVMTNGLRLAEPGVVELMQDGGVGTFHVSIDTVHGPTYDQISRSNGKLDRQLRGLDRALAQQNAFTYLYTATTKLNAPTLPALLQDLYDRSTRLGLSTPPPVVFAVVKPIGDAVRHAEQLLLEPGAAAALIANLVAVGLELGVPVGYRNVQACLLPELVSRNMDYYLDDFSVEVATGKRVVYGHALEYWHKPPSCAPCGHFSICTGLYRTVTAAGAAAWYRPIGREGLRSA